MLFFGSRNQKRESIQQELEKNREILNEISSYLNDFLAFLPLAICDVSPKGVIVNINKAFERLTGFSEVEIVGEDLTSIFLEQSKINNLLQLATRKKFIQQEELTLVSKEKKKIKTSVSFATRKDSFGNLTGFFVSITDITQFKELQTEMEKKIQERTKDLEESRKALLNILEDTEEARRKAEEEKKKILEEFKPKFRERYVGNILTHAVQQHLADHGRHNLEKVKKFHKRYKELKP